MEQTTGEVYWKLFIPHEQRELLIQRLTKAGMQAVTSPWHGEGYCYVEVTAAQADDTLRQLVRGCVNDLSCPRL